MLTSIVLVFIKRVIERHLHFAESARGGVQKARSTQPVVQRCRLGGSEDFELERKREG